MKKDLLIIFAIILGFAVLVSGTEFQSVEDYYLTHADEIREDSDTVFVTVNCEKALSCDEISQAQREEIGDGRIVSQKEYVLLENETPFDVLKRVCRYERIHMEYQGADKNVYNSVYVQGINYLYEFDCGELSGWIVLVNGKEITSSSGKFKLSDGDRVEWIYSLDMGRDV